MFNNALYNFEIHIMVKNNLLKNINKEGKVLMKGS